MSGSRFQSTFGAAHNQYAMVNHHPWKTSSSSSSSSGSGGSRKIDRFLTRSKRRKKPSCGSDSSIFTASTSQSSSQSSQLSGRSSVSPTPGLRRIDEPLPESPAPSAVSFSSSFSFSPDPNRDPRGTIAGGSPYSSPVRTINKHLPPPEQSPTTPTSPSHQPIDVDSMQEYCRPPPSTPPRSERGVFQRDTNDDLQKPPPPRSPKPIESSPSPTSPNAEIVATRTICSPLKPPQPPPKILPPRPRATRQQRQKQLSIGPIDVDSMEAYLEDESVESLAMMNIEDPSAAGASEIKTQYSETSSLGDVSSSCSAGKPEIPSLQRTNSSSLEDSTAFTTVSSLTAFEEGEKDESEGQDNCQEEDEEEDEDASPLDPLMKLEKMDLLAESDGEEDYARIRVRMKRFPVLDEREAERGLCGYIRGFEPPMESVRRPTPTPPARPNTNATPAAVPSPSPDCAFEI